MWLTAVFFLDLNVVFSPLIDKSYIQRSEALEKWFCGFHSHQTTVLLRVCSLNIWNMWMFLSLRDVDFQERWSEVRSRISNLSARPPLRESLLTSKGGNPRQVQIRALWGAACEDVRASPPFLSAQNRLRSLGSDGSRYTTLQRVSQLHHFQERGVRRWFSSHFLSYISQMFYFSSWLQQKGGLLKPEHTGRLFLLADLIYWASRKLSWVILCSDSALKLVSYVIKGSFLSK